MWLPHLGLNDADRDDILQGRDMTGDIADAALQIFRKRFNIQGLQATAKAEFGSFDAVSGPAVQIHPDLDHNHCFVSCFFNGQIYVADSDGWKITPCASRQLQDLYGTVVPKNTLQNIQILDVDQQEKGSEDCMVYSIATVVELLYTGTLPTCRYNAALMRPHLIKCLEAGKFTPFPKSRKRKLCDQVESSKQIKPDPAIASCSLVPDTRKRKCHKADGRKKRR